MGIHQPHDKFFKKAFEMPEVAADFVVAHANKDDLKKLDLKTLHLQRNSYIDGKFRAIFSDVVYRVSTAEGEGYLYLLLEHQSTGDPLMPLRLLQYATSIMLQDASGQLANRASNRGIKMPVIYPFVLYSGQGEFVWPTEFTANIEGFVWPIEALKKSCISLSTYTLNDIMRDGKAALVEFLLKESWQKDFCKVLRKNPQLSRLINKSPYATDAMLYMIDQDSHDGDKVINTIDNLDQNLKDEIMNGLRRIEQRGIKLGEQRGIKLGEQRGIKLGEQRGEQRGIKLGEQSGMAKVIKQLLASGMDRPQVAKRLGFTLQKLESLLMSVG